MPAYTKGENIKVTVPGILHTENRVDRRKTKDDHSNITLVLLANASFFFFVGRLVYILLNVGYTVYCVQ